MTDSDLPAICRTMTFEGVNSIVCEVDLRIFKIDLARAGADGKAYGSLQAFIDAQLKDARPVLSMNAGMYEKDLSAVGLYVEDGKQAFPLKTGEGEGNFFLKPNGVFFIDKTGTPGILETGAFATAAVDPRIATQSGPMLVINGQIHPRFEPNGASRFIRNGVGVRDANTIVLAISKAPVSLGSFARLFKDGLGCANALFFDGGISALSNDRKTLIGGMDPVGPIIAVFKK
ncbi:phosphodiester glycosidase family protein [Phyllobacterium sp. 628]|uniref:phosphodiester glycosidase family protein n=1 Tax=Phyllobacterium sp. 628 TaxID=2718938 RepID=UPI001FCEEBDB|nr:phosphodiester glycosidase family protein [Phyllobacterium sp. 628]